MESKKFYIVSKEYVGPNQNSRCNSHTVSITTVAPRTNSSNEVRVYGWLGTTNDWSEYAHGEFDTLEEAKAALEIEFPDLRDNEIEEYEMGYYGIEESYLIGKYEEMDRESTSSWIYWGLKDDISKDTTDEQIETILEGYEQHANQEGMTLDLNTARKDAIAIRDDLVTKAREEEEENN